MTAEELRRHCQGRRILGKSPSRYIFKAHGMGEKDFNDLFENVVEVNMCVEIHSTFYSHLHFSNVRRWTSCISGPALSIVGNPYLKYVELNENVKFVGVNDNKPEIIIRGNRRFIPYNTLRQTLDPYGVKWQKEGECVSPSNVEDLSELNCDAYYGDIGFSYKPAGELPASGGEVDGCLVISNTLLTDIEFLRSFYFKPNKDCQNAIVNNKYLCISESLEAHLRKQMKIKIEGNLPNRCREYLETHVVLFAAAGLFLAVLSTFCVLLRLYTM
ncbi:unnamed protein product [Cylicocyclus nassatus]|uniref:Uncharacterized protein n=1 Tax=Cylicocyclus nassatus TaxID=53992 RepID=A0AA36H955_CYLNA|nr:unnamed protein product [Cylicocyclus nassatus]